VFIQRFEAATAIPLEPIYSGKVLWALVNLIAVDFFAEGSRLLVIHGGGLQGRRAFEG
jgi:1-aminocyclopropane-1-carboxylate deaminase